MDLLLAVTCVKTGVQGGLSYGWGSVVLPRLREKAQAVAQSEARLECLRSQALLLVVRRLEVGAGVGVCRRMGGPGLCVWVCVGVCD